MTTNATPQPSAPPPRFRRGKLTRPPRILLYGAEKIGKTTFAASCPGVVFLPTEDGNENHNCDSYDDSVLSFDQFDFNLAEICQFPRDWSAVCIDSITGLERLIHRKICQRAGVSSISEVGGGFGKGAIQTAEMLQTVLQKLNYLRTEKNMAILLTAHADAEKFVDPEGGSWDRWELRGGEAYTKIWVEWVDTIAFCKQQTILKEEKMDFSKRTVAVPLAGDPNGGRVMLTRGGPGLIGGSRVTLPEVLPLQWGAFINAYTAATNAAAGV